MLKLNIPTFKLNNGLNIPALGYGTWVGLDDKLEFLSQDIPKLKEAMSYAIDVGFRHIDTAHLYRVEPEVGHVVSQKIREGVVRREDVFITTKVWNNNHRPADVEASVRGSLKRLGLDYVDCVLMHWPMSISADGMDEKIDYVDTWRGFESVLKQGLAKSIGVSNFNVEQLTRLLANATVMPVINQVEVNLNLGQKELVEFCKKHNILVVAYTPFGSLYRSPAGDGTKNEDKASPKCFGKRVWKTEVPDPVLTPLALKHGKTIPQVILRYLYQRGIVSIPKSLTKSRILENASIFDFELDEQDVTTLEKFDNNYRTNLPSFWQNYVNYPFEKVDGEIPKIPPTLLAP